MELEKRLTKIETEISELKKNLTVTVVNGKRMEKPLNEAVAEIWDGTAILRDANKIHGVFRKYRIYRIILGLIGIGILFHLGLSLKQIIINFLQ